MESTILDKVNSQNFPLVDIIDYSTDSIVSKTIAKNNGGSAIVFSFDMGQGLTEHNSPVDALIYLIEGEGTITVNGKVSEMQAGEIIAMPANSPHSVKATKKMKMMLIMLKI